MPNILRYKTSLLAVWLGIFSMLGVVKAQSLPNPSISITHFDNSASYAPGSSISIHVFTDGNYPLTNSFELVLSDGSGNFTGASPVIGTRSDFFTPIMVGTIPANTTAGTGYRLKVRAVLGAAGTPPEATSAAFTISSGTAPPALTLNLTWLQSSYDGFINCPTADQF